jgi:hypothetical protein
LGANGIQQIQQKQPIDGDLAAEAGLQPPNKLSVLVRMI